MAGGFHLPVSAQKIVKFTGHITGGHKKGYKFVAESFFGPMNELDPEKKLVVLHMFNGASVLIKTQKILKIVYPMMSCNFVAEHTCHNVFKGWASIEEINKLCR